MTENEYPGAMVMVKIDGGKVKQLREQKGLTQLYVATAVQVTTDTISRWENKRYPTIKKENGLRLAQALEVDLEEILEQESNIADQVHLGPPEQPQQQEIDKSLRTIWPILLLSLTFMTILGGVYWFFFSLEESPLISATRTLPARCTIGQPFPVVIEITGAEQAPVAIILKEQAPSQAHILKTEPALPTLDQNTTMLKWIHKADGKTLFSYIAVLNAHPADQAVFSGTISAGNDDTPRSIQGSDTMTAGFFHWADSNGDNVISDREILTVYDQYGDIEQLGLNVDLIEEMWLGSGYKWNPQQQSYEILP